MTIQQWEYVPKGEVGTAYYHRKYKGYEVELHEVNGRTEIAIYKNGAIQKPPFPLEVEISEFLPRYEAIMTTIDDLINSLTQDYVAKSR